MASRPALTDSTFYAHLFSPRRQPQPTGLRHRILKGLKGQTRSRLRSYNRMSAVNQEVINRSGRRDEYLKGDVTFKDLKTVAREKAIRLGVAKPVRQRSRFKQTPLDKIVQAHLRRTVNSAGRRFNERTSDREIVHMQTDDMEDVLTWQFGEVRYAGRPGSEYEVVTPDGVTHNPFWYH